MFSTRRPLASDTSRLTAAEAARRREHLRALDESARPSAAPEPIAVRLLGPADAAEIVRLAGADSAHAPSGEILGAEVSGRLVAALSLDDASLIADPFRPTAAAVELLRMRARQLGLPRPRRGLRVRLPSRRRSRSAALVPSPPGGGGRLLRL